MRLASPSPCGSMENKLSDAPQLLMEATMLTTMRFPVSMRDI
jgi:hypothetical protein